MLLNCQISGGQLHVDLPFYMSILKENVCCEKKWGVFSFLIEKPCWRRCTCAKIVRLDIFFIPNINISYFKEQHINLEKSETITKKIYKCYLCLWKNCITVTESDCVTLPYCMKIKS